jgi:glycosyltransferase involved in cell wall biosynthesis
LLEKIELFLYRRATVVVPNTHSFKSNLIERGIEASKIKVVTNGSNLDRYTPQPKNRELMNRLGINGEFVVGYVGTIGMAHRLDFIVKAISKIDDPDFFFLFVGDGARRREVEALSKELKLDNVMFLDSVPKDMVPDYLSIIDAALIPLRKSDTFKSVIPSKIFESAAMRKPILLGVDGEAKRLVTRYEAGTCFVPEDEEDFITKLRDLRDDRERYGELTKGCARLAADYDRKKLAVEMLHILHEAAGVEAQEATRPAAVAPVLSAARYVETLSNGTFGRIHPRSHRRRIRSSSGSNGRDSGTGVRR